jgi:hypothetical protein
VVVSDGLEVTDIEGLDLAVVVIQDQGGILLRREVDPTLLLLDERVRPQVVVVTMCRELELTL